MGAWIEVVTPDGEQWTDQRYLLRRDAIVAVRLVKKLQASGGPENGVDIRIMSSTYSASNGYWVRCPTFEAAVALYNKIMADLAGDD